MLKLRKSFGVLVLIILAIIVGNKFGMFSSKVVDANSVLNMIDINNLGFSSDPLNLISFGDNFLFWADDGIHGYELWISDGTSSGTSLVKDIFSGSNSSIEPIYVKYLLGGDTLYFLANDGIHGIELWRTDGTDAGTTLVKDIYPGVNGTYGDMLGYSGGILYFTSNNSVNGYELWKTDGTQLGTVMVKDIYPGSYSSNINRWTSLLNEFYFFANNGTNGHELWKTDGTTEGTVLVKDIQIGLSPSVVGTGVIVNMNEILYFFANDGFTGSELWKSDGTEAGTTLVKDINPGGSGSNGFYRNGVIVYNENIFFSASDSVNGQELWKTDGTESGTILVKDILPGIEGTIPENFIVVNNILLFSAYDYVNGTELWKTDGTEMGTVLLKDIYVGSNGSNIGSMVLGGTEVYFYADTAEYGRELWKSDGTENGTVLLDDIKPGVEGSDPWGYIWFNDALYFSADEGIHGRELWKSDGTPLGTTVLKDIWSGTEDAFFLGKLIPLPYYPLEINEFNNKAFFGGSDGVHGFELWSSDGTLSGTSLVRDVSLGTPDGEISGYGKLGDALYFRANNGTNGKELWKTDGTSDGTTMVKNICADGGLIFRIIIGPPPIGSICSSAPDGFTTLDNILLFVANDGINGIELWRTDGTDAGTVMVKNIYPGIVSSNPDYLTVVGEDVFFVANDGVYGEELWKTDGTETGTYMVKDIREGVESSYIYELVEMDGILYFNADNGIDGDELWRSDGTEEGTWMVKDIWEGVGGGYPYWITEINGTLYFQAGNQQYGYELWKSDGTEAGTLMVKDINSGVDDSEPYFFTSVGDVFYFVAYDSTHGDELWKSNGTEAGTMLVKDVNEGVSSGRISELVKVGNMLYFSGNDGIYGDELWKSDGTESGTLMVNDIFSGSVESLPSAFELIGDNLFFIARDEYGGGELFVLNVDLGIPVISLNTSSPLVTNDTNPTFIGSVTDNMSTITSVDFKVGDSDWESCVSNDGQFNETVENFVCNPSSPLNDGQYTVLFRARDDELNVTEPGNEPTLELTVDTVDPLLKTEINGGATHTNNLSITVALDVTESHSGVSEMIVCEDVDFSGCSWELFSSYKKLILSVGDETKTVYSKVKDKAGNISSVVEAKIILDTIVEKPIITKLGLIKSIPDQDYIYVNYTSTLAMIYGKAEALGKVNFVVDGLGNYSTEVNAEGDFYKAIKLPTGLNKITYSCTDLAGNVSKERILIINVDPEYLTRSEDITEVDTDISSDDESKSENTDDGNSIIADKQETDYSYWIIVDEDGEPLKNAVISVDGNEYDTDENGYVYTDEIFNENSIIEIDGERYSFSADGRFIKLEAIKPLSAVSGKFTYWYCIIPVILIAVVLGVVLVKRKTKST